MPHTPPAAAATEAHQRRSAMPASYQVAWVAAGVRTAAREAGVDLPVDYAHRVTADGLDRATQLGVTALGAGVVIHTASESPDQLPVVLGYADPGGQWLRDGRRYHPAATHVAPEPPVEVIEL
jgi:hypothetical protein